MTPKGRGGMCECKQVNIMGTKKGQVRKTARRAYVSKRGKGPRRPKITASGENNTYAPIRFTSNKGQRGEKSSIVLSKTGKLMDLWSGKSIGFGKLLRRK